MTKLEFYNALENEIAPITIPEIAKAVCDHFGVSVAELIHKSRIQPYTDARKAFCLICRREQFTLLRIARFLNRDHSTVIYSQRQAVTYLEIDSEFKRKYTATKRQLFALRFPQSEEKATA